MDRYILVLVDSVVTGVEDFAIVVDTIPSSGNARAIARGDVGAMAAIRDVLNAGA
jgi:hypothetical protein